MSKEYRIAQRLKLLMCDIVRAQDEGYAMFENLERERFGHSFIHGLSVEVDLARDRMVRNGDDVYTRDSAAFILGLDNRQFKNCAHHWEHDSVLSERQGKDIQICHRCGSRNRVDLQPDTNTDTEESTE